MSRSARFGAILVALAAAMVAGAYASALPQAPGSLAGVVVTADTPPQPVRRAIVKLSGAAIALNLSAVTDDRGAFAFENVPAGTYEVSASKAAYITQQFGAKRPGARGTPLTLAAGQRLADLRFVLSRGAVLAGAVRDGAGGPAPNLQVTVAPSSQLESGSDYYTPPSPIMTDDRGAYRAYGLSPGEYVVAVTPRMPGPGAITPRVATRLSPRTIEALMQDLDRRASGRASTAPAPPSEPARARPISYAPTYYPGTAMVADAARIRLAAGETRDGLDFVVDFVPIAKIDGSIVTADAAPLPGVNLSITPVGPPLPMFAGMTYGSRQTADGVFSFLNLTPGRYVIFASGRTGTPPVDTTARGGGGFRGGGPAGAGALWAMADISINGVDVTGVVLTMRPAFGFSGKVAFDGALPEPSDLTKLTVGLIVTQDAVNGLGAAASSVPGLPRPSPATLSADGAFSITGIWPGAYIPVIAVPGIPAWRLRSVLVDGRDILDTPLVLDGSGTDVKDALVTFSDKHSTLSGMLQLPTGQAATDHAVIVFPADRALWRSNRRVQSTRPATDGHFAFVDLPAGDYCLAAIGDLDESEWRQMAFLDQAVNAAVKVTVVDGKTVTQLLRIR